MTKKAKWSKAWLYKRRAKEFWSLFKTSRKGLLGLAILLFFIVLAASAPLLAPYDPILDTDLAGYRAKPVWLKQLAYPDLSENYFPISDPGLTSPESFDTFLITLDPSYAPFTVSYMDGEGYRDPGVIYAVYHRTTAEALGPVKLRLTIPFEYIYSSPPAHFKAFVAVKYSSPTESPATVRVYIVDDDGERYTIWEEGLRQDRWTASTPYIDSRQAELRMRLFQTTQKDPAEVIFDSKGNYLLEVEIEILDEGETCEAEVYIDQIDIKLFGEAFGLLGTDFFGRDIWSQFVQGTRISLLVGLLASTIAVIAGLAVGVVAGYFGKAVDEILMRFTDLLLVLPYLPLLLVLVALFGSNIWIIILILGLLGWMSFARVIRSQVLSLKERPFVEAARAIGAGSLHIITKHIIPNVVSLVYVTLALSVPSAIVAEAALSFLGFGDPFVMSWGRMLHDVHYYGAYVDLWWVIPPGVGIALISLSFILIGYAIDEILNPRLRRRR